MPAVLLRAAVRVPAHVQAHVVDLAQLQPAAVAQHRVLEARAVALVGHAFGARHNRKFPVALGNAVDGHIEDRHATPVVVMLMACTVDAVAGVCARSSRCTCR